MIWGAVAAVAAVVGVLVVLLRISYQLGMLVERFDGLAKMVAAFDKRLVAVERRRPPRASRG